jgi:hypothetical protein
MLDLKKILRQGELQILGGAAAPDEPILAGGIARNL